MNVVFGFLLKFLGGGFIKVAADGLLKAQQQRLDAEGRDNQLIADQNIAFWQNQVTLAQDANKQRSERQKVKMNYLVFWFILGVALFPGLGTFVLLSVYNVLWWSEGIWPQTWSIAAFPPPYDAWAQMSIEWVFDPVQLGLTTLVAAGGGYITGTRKSK